ncbi:BTB POZ fold protein [Rutstroemia sp. NJR-2017a WRK4]|nr:BTB POZ fold protein [Rutstroemia sp. NJR-2017a WRK4]
MGDEVQSSELVETSHTPCPKLPADEFVKMTSNYQGPNVKIYVDSPEIGPKDAKVYELPRNLLSRSSPFFEAAFNGSFAEKDTQIMRIECSSVAFDLVVQVIYTDSFVLPASVENSTAVKLDLMLDFLILSDRLLLGSNDTAVAKMKKLIKESNLSLEPRHVRKAAEYLPSGHEIRELFALACVWPYILIHQPDKLVRYGLSRSEIIEEVEEVEGFASDLFKAHRKIYKDMKYSNGVYILTNPLTGESIPVKTG